MIGAIAGDIIGSVYEWNNIKTTDFPLFDRGCHFTDDTVLTVAVADCILHGGDYASKFKEYYKLYPHAGYGGMFHRWARSSSTAPYNSFGNGSAMRVSPAGFAFDSLEQVLSEAERSAAVTHNHPEGIKGAQATATAIYLSRKGMDKQEIRNSIEKRFGYNLSRRLDDIREEYGFDETCPGSVPEAIIAFIESEGYEDAIRKAVSLGGDSDTIACITGGIAQAFYGGVPQQIKDSVYDILDDRLRAVVQEFCETYSLV